MNKVNRIVLFATMAASVLLCTSTAQAHKLNVFATAEGQKIIGYAYFSGGVRPANITVKMLTTGGEQLGQTTTNDNGEFEFQMVRSCDCVLIAGTVDGHQAKFVIKANELPDELTVTASTAPNELDERTNRLHEDSGQALSEAVAGQIRPMREQLDRLEAKNRMQDVLGSAGYLIGVAGIAFYFLALRKLRQHDGSKGPSQQP